MKNGKHKILIIKIGHSETLAPDISTATSYGDVLRTTVLLHLYKNDHITWLTDEKAYLILKNNAMIDRLLFYNLTTVLQLQSEQFDTVINLEKIPGMCAFADSIKAWRRYGFRFDTRTGEAEAYDGSHVVLEMCRHIEKKIHRKACWQEGLFEMVGAEWKGEPYVLSYSSAQNEENDIGFNYQVGNKWPLKAWPLEYWEKLEKELKGSYRISWQKGLENIDEYIKWINTCRLIITNDSFGLHVAIALKKKIIALFGPTDASETYLYNLGVSFTSQEFQCDKFPCAGVVKKCPYFAETCMECIKPSLIAQKVAEMLS